MFFFFKQKTAYEMRISDWSSDVCSSDLIAAMADRDMLLIVSPAQHLRKVVAQAPAGTPLILCSKGIEAGTGLLMSEVAAQAQPASPIAVLSGPTFAHEVAKGLPTAITLACTEIGRAHVWTPVTNAQPGCRL